MKLLRRPISASDRIPDRFCVISMEFPVAELQTFLLAKLPSAAMSEEKRPAVRRLESSRWVPPSEVGQETVPVSMLELSGSINCQTCHLNNQ